MPVSACFEELKNLLTCLTMIRDNFSSLPENLKKSLKNPDIFDQEFLYTCVVFLPRNLLDHFHSIYQSGPHHLKRVTLC